MEVKVAGCFLASRSRGDNEFSARLHLNEPDLRVEQASSLRLLVLNTKQGGPPSSRGQSTYWLGLDGVQLPCFVESRGMLNLTTVGSVLNAMVIRLTVFRQEQGTLLFAHHAGHLIVAHSFDCML